MTSYGRADKKLTLKKSSEPAEAKSFLSTYELFWFTALLTSNVWVPPTNYPTRWTPTGYPTTQSNSDSNYLELGVSIPQIKGLVPQDWTPAPTPILDAIHKSWASHIGMKTKYIFLLISQYQRCARSWSYGSEPDKHHLCPQWSFQLLLLGVGGAFHKHVNSEIVNTTDAQITKVLLHVISL